MWTSGIGRQNEAAKVAHEVVEYFKGRCFDLGCGGLKVFPARNVTGVDNGQQERLFGAPVHCDIVGDVERLDWLADASLEVAFSSHVLQCCADFKAVLAEWWRLVKPGGHLILYLPDRRHYPVQGMPGADPAHRHDFVPEDITFAMREIAWRSGRGWHQVRNEVRSGGEEYGFLQVYRKLETVACKEYVAPARPRNSLGIVRLGAFGDALWLSALLPALCEQYEHITLYTGTKGEEVMRHDPHLGRIVVLPEHLFGWDDQENERRGFATIGTLLSGFIQRVERNHDRLLNLIGTVEGSLLPHKTHANYWLPPATRRAVMGGQNYLEVIHKAARVPFDPRTLRVRFYPTEAERNEAAAERARHAGPFAVLAPTGSSLPKHWPHSQRAMELLAEQGVGGVLLGELRGVEYKAPAGWRVVGTQWPIRKAMAVAALADVVVGTESAIINSVSHEPPLKIVLLSHSSAVQLTRDWRRTIAVEPTGLDCHPCHRIHADWQHCTVARRSGAAACQDAVEADLVVDYISQWLRGELVDDDLRAGTLAEVA